MNVIRPVTLGDTGAFTRASTKTYIGADGLLHQVAVNVPAFQYAPLNLGAAPVALLELAATNLLIYSEQFDNAAWTKSNVSVAANTQIGPDGALTADTLTLGATSSAKYVREAYTATAVAYTITLYARAGTVAWLGLSFGAGAQSDGGFFDLASGAIGTLASGTSAAIVALPGSWFRCSVTRALTAATYYHQIEVHGADNEAPTFTSIGTETLYAWGAQAELGGAGSSYIATTTGAMTRAADVITGTGLIYSNAPEVAPAAYAGGTTYGLGATASVAGAAGLITVYESLQASNTGHAPASSPTWWTNIGTTYQVYSGAATYALGDLVIDAAAHMTYESLVGANSGNALTNIAKWGAAGATNRWAAFDKVVGTSVSMAGAILMIVVPGPVDSLGMLNISAKSTTIAMIDQSNMAMVYSVTTDLTSDLSITDYDTYFFEDVVTTSDLYTDGIPPYYSGALSIALTGSETIRLGVAVLGNAFDLGGARTGLRVGFISYTKKITDENGNTSAEKGANSKRMTVTTMIENSVLDKTLRVMEDLDGISTVWVGAGNLYTSLIQFAFSKEFEIEIAYQMNSLCSHQLEGLI